MDLIERQALALERIATATEEFGERQAAALERIATTMEQQTHLLMVAQINAGNMDEASRFDPNALNAEQPESEADAWGRERFGTSHRPGEPPHAEKIADKP